jgi:hypothetical protein
LVLRGGVEVGGEVKSELELVFVFVLLERLVMLVMMLVRMRMRVSETERAGAREAFILEMFCWSEPF